jgi:hypothetical protein
MFFNPVSASPPPNSRFWNLGEAGRGSKHGKKTFSQDKKHLAPSLIFKMRIAVVSFVFENQKQENLKNSWDSPQGGLC